MLKKEYFDMQNEFVIKEIMNTYNYDLYVASNLWYNSKTKREIQEVEEMYYLSRVRCFDELQKELNNDPTWMIGTFD